MENACAKKLSSREKEEKVRSKVFSKTSTRDSRDIPET